MREVRVAVVIGTRPEAIKMFPVVAALKAAGVAVMTCVTAQHRDMLDQVLSTAGLVPDIDLDLMRPAQTLDQLAARLLEALGGVFEAHAPARVLVQGDTSTAMAAALAAHHHRIPVAHVEAGLRSGDPHRPWPEEVNRKIVTAIADLHFAPTRTAAEALMKEGVLPATIHMTGNTVIDALHWACALVEAEPMRAAGLDPIAERFAGKPILAVTAHRRESLGPGLGAIARAVRRLAARGDIGIVVPVHPNPAVRTLIEGALNAVPGVALVESLDYPHFVRLLMMSHLLLSDSGGVQEEAPALGKPVLILRETTERPEGVTAGGAKLVGVDEDRVVAEAATLLDDPAAYRAMARIRHPFGEGGAAERIARVIGETL